LEGEFDQHDVAIGVPCVIGKNGMEKVYEVELSPEEKGEFTKSCDIIRSYLIRSNEVK
jgi:L-lactate dehydrogenase